MGGATSVRVGDTTATVGGATGCSPVCAAVATGARVGGVTVTCTAPPVEGSTSGSPWGNTGGTKFGTSCCTSGIISPLLLSSLLIFPQALGYLCPWVAPEILLLVLLLPKVGEWGVPQVSGWVTPLPL